MPAAASQTSRLDAVLERCVSISSGTMKEVEVTVSHGFQNLRSQVIFCPKQVQSAHSLFRGVLLGDADAGCLMAPPDNDDASELVFPTSAQALMRSELYPKP